MTELDAVLELASDNTAGVFSLSADTLAVLFFALGLAQNIEVWKDYPDEPLTDEQIDEITELVDWASDELMREVFTVPTGAIMLWFEEFPPDGWLICDGSGVLKTQYPDLFALYGDRYGETVDFFGIPDLSYRSPFGAVFAYELGSEEGERTHTLSISEMPSHTHPPLSPFTSFLGNRSGGTNTAPASTFIGAAATTGAAGGGAAHNNMHPVFYCWYIVCAGKVVT